MAEEPLHLGHRERLWKSFLKQGFDAAFVLDYQKLEFLLTLVIPRVDTKPAAKLLLKRFGSLRGVFTAPVTQLREVAGIGARAAAFLNMLHALDVVLAREELGHRRILAKPELMKRYLIELLGSEKEEWLVVLYLDGSFGLLHEQRLFRGTLDRVPTYGRELAKESLAWNAAAVVLAHNHPDGNATPSLADVKRTNQLRESLETVGVVLLDHWVIAARDAVSMVERGLISTAS